MRFLTRGEEKEYKAGMIIFQEGQLSDNSVYYVIEGNVETTIMNDNETILDQQLASGSVLGVTACFVKKGKHIATATALTDTKVYVWDKESFIAIVGVYQEIAKLVITELSKRLRELNKILASRKNKE